MAEIVKVKVFRRGPQGAIDPADRQRFDRAVVVSQTIEERIGEAAGAASEADRRASAAGEAAGIAQGAMAATQELAGQVSQNAGDAERAREAAAGSEALAADYAAAAAHGAEFRDTIAEGRELVEDGETFGVLAGGVDGLERPTVYRRNSATTQSVLVELASNAEVTALSARLGSSGNGSLLVAYDTDGRAIAYVDDSAEWHLTRLGAKSLQQHIIDANVQIALAGPAIESVGMNGNATLWRVVTADGRSPIVLDDFGNLYVAQLGGTPLQQHIKTAQDRLIEAAPAIESVNRVASPHLARMTTAEGHVFGLTDELGNWYIPRLGHVSVQDQILRMKDKMAQLPGNAVTQMLKRRRVYDAVHDFAVPNDGLTDASASIQAAINLLSSQSATLGPSVLYFREGAYRLVTRLTPRSNVSIVMAGWGKARFLPVGTESAFTGFYTAASPLFRANFLDVEIDGELQSHTGPNVGTKGMFLQSWADCQFLRVNIHDTWATGLGIDYSAGESANGGPGGSWIIDGRFEGNGRGSEFNDPGSSGIGIGTGKYAKEPLIIARCICRKNRNFGAFFERQHTAQDIHVARQMIVMECILSENGAGFAEAGAGGTIVVGNQANDNVLDGFLSYGGTISSSYEGPHPGLETTYAENVATGNGRDGIRADYSRNKEAIRTGFYTNHNQAHRNAGAGIRLIGHPTFEMTDFALRNDELKLNGEGGIVLSGGSFRALDILQPRLLDNTGSAIRIDAALRDSRIFAATARSTLATALQTTAISGAGALTDADISECVQTGHAIPNALTGTQTRVTFGRNPGFSF